MKENESLSLILQAYENMKQAKSVKCTCTGFVVQYQGCGCGRSIAMQRADSELWAVLDRALQGNDNKW